MSIQQKKFNRLKKELRYVQSELEYVQEVLNEWHLIFDKYHRDYCKKNNIDLDNLNRNNSEKVDQIIPKPIQKENGVILYENKQNKDMFKKLYKKIAMKIHPDLGGDVKEFQKVTTAMQEKNFDKILDVCEKHDILIEADPEIIKFLQEQIDEVKAKISAEKSTYSWCLYSCQDEKCKDQVIKRFLKHLFNYKE